MPATTSTIYAHITKDPEVCGGKACIDGTRIRVMDIVALEREGYVPEKMLNVFAVPLTLGQVHAALAYYYDHQAEIEASFTDPSIRSKSTSRIAARWSEPSILGAVVSMSAELEAAVNLSSARTTVRDKPPNNLSATLDGIRSRSGPGDINGD